MAPSAILKIPNAASVYRVNQQIFLTYTLVNVQLRQNRLKFVVWQKFSNPNAFASQILASNEMSENQKKKKQNKTIISDL